MMTFCLGLPSLVPWALKGGKKGVQSPAINEQKRNLSSKQSTTMVCLTADHSIIRPTPMFLEMRKSAWSKKQVEEQATPKAAYGARLVRAVCLPVCAWSVGIFNNYTQQFFMACNISLLITSSQILTQHWLAKPQRLFWLKMFLFSWVIARIMRAPLFKSDYWHQQYLIWLQCFQDTNYTHTHTTWLFTRVA